MLCGSSTTVLLGYVGSVRRLELVATDAISVHQLISCCAEIAPVAPGISQRNQDVTRPGRGLNMLNICLRRALVVTERMRRNRRSRQWFIVENYSRGKYSAWAHCVTKRHLYCIAKTVKLLLRR